MSVATMMATLKLNISDFASKLDTASNKLAKFANNAQNDYGKAATTLKSHNLGLKDTARIVQGIVISQAFYSAVNAITNATSALWDFNKELDYAKVTYAALFGSTDLASKFTAELQEHAVNTIFDYQQLAAVSKKLLAYGIEYENLMYIMEGLTNLGAMSGDAAAMDRIALALGQIQTTGYLTATEMRQLANAYVPIYDIIQDSFGLNGKQMARVGDLKLPAEQVINAVVEYANAKFGAVGDAAMYTITGLENKIVDTLKTVGVEMLQPISNAYKSFLVYISQGLEGLRAAFKSDGLNGVFEFLVPNESTQRMIKQFLGNVKNLLMTLASVAQVAAQLFGNFAHVFVTAFNLFTPVITTAINLLAAMAHAMLENKRVAAILRVAITFAAAAFVLLRIQAMAAMVVTALTQAITTLSKALVILGSIITRHPILVLLLALGASLVGVAASSDSANKSLSNLFATITGAGSGSSGASLDFGSEMASSADSVDTFNNRLEDSVATADELSSAMGDVGKSAKKGVGLLSFDEVYKLPEKTSAAGGGGGGGGGAIGAIEDLIGAFDGLGDALIPEVPDFSEYISDFTSSLFGGLNDGIMDKLKSIGIGTTIGTVLGGIIGGLLGGPAGAKLGLKIGAFAGGLAGLIWEWLEGALNNTAAGGASGIVGAISNALSKAGAAGIGTILKNAFASGGVKGAWAALGGVLKTTGLKSILKGGAIGAAVGLVVDTLAHLLWNWMADSIEGADAESAKVGQTIGGVLGTVIGALLGGPAGAMIGSAIGTFAVGLVGLFWEPIAEYFDPDNNALSAFFVDLAEEISIWAADTLESLSGWFVDSALGFADWVSETWESLSTWFTDTTGGLSTWYDDTVAIFSDWDSINSETLGTWWDSTKESFSTWASDTYTSINNWRKDTIGDLTTWASDAYNELNTWRTDTLTAVDEWAADTYTSISGWCEDTINDITSWVSEAYNELNTWRADTLAVFDGFAIAAVKAIKQWGTDAYKEITDRLISIKTKWSEKWEEIKTSFNTWWNNLGIGTLLETKVWKPISDFFNINTFWNRLKGLLDAIKKKVNNWWDGLLDGKLNVSASFNGSNVGHASGGVFNREHIARFAEGNKAEAIIPLENNRAMQPFVDAVSNGLVSSLAPIVANINAGNSSSLPPLYVGTLIADDRGIKQLYDKFEVIRLQESDRRGTTYA